LFWFWTKRGLYSEGKLWLEQALAAAPGAPGPLRARALIGLAHMHHFQGRPFDDEISEALSLGRQEADDWLISFAVFMQALSALERGEYERACALSVEAEQAGARCDDEVQRAGPLLILANIAVQNGDYARAHSLYEEAIAVERRAGESWGLSIVLSAAAGLRIVQDDFDGARGHASEVLSLSQALEDPRGIAWSLDLAAGLLAAGGESDGAARLWGASDRLLESVGGQLSPEIRWIRARFIDPVRTSLGTPAFESARADGRTMALADAINLARQLALLLR
jgi:non-specific serine/threonine protein kinase